MDLPVRAVCCTAARRPVGAAGISGRRPGGMNPARGVELRMTDPAGGRAPPFREFYVEPYRRSVSVKSIACGG
ncbi:hypothetical protein A6M21_02900 [Desulfotomaculum copahuensis]|uniref:Uncharacterized protein n=1 Tax=Desulfotomaculum copahuensis TaxID=1838280 RepID=A0A1B7LIL1_9FIRM|nr:hypothetical protein A6M21_02900 [Desulfotomaculum copahuensis]